MTFLPLLVIISPMSNIRRHKLNPFKVMMVLLYEEHPYISWDGQVVTVKNGPLARRLKVPNSRLREYFEWLHHWKYIDSLSFVYGQSSFSIVLPPQLANLTLKEGILAEVNRESN